MNTDSIEKIELKTENGMRVLGIGHARSGRGFLIRVHLWFRSRYDRTMEVALWNDLAKRAGVKLSPEQHQLLSRYLDLLIEANQTMNLTRIVTREAAEVGHIGDALTLLPFLPKEKIRLADVGTGGGVPGIPLAI